MLTPVASRPFTPVNMRRRRTARRAGDIGDRAAESQMEL
jgi:hypothetical protein